MMYLPQNINLSAMPGNINIPAAVMAAVKDRPRVPTPEPVPESGGYLDPETGEWVQEEENGGRSSRDRSSRSSREQSRSRDVPSRDRGERDGHHRSSRSSPSRDRSSRSSAGAPDKVTPIKISLNKSDKNTQVGHTFPF